MAALERPEAAPEGAATYVDLPVEARRFVDAQYRLAYDLVAAARHPETGAYADAYHWTPSPQVTMCSVAAVGVGLVALCLADAEGWAAHAGAQALHTLRGMTGRVPGFRPAREAVSGFFCHFVDIATGTAWPRSEFSTIDTALLVAGALFAQRYFASAGRPEADAIGALADELFATVQWGRAVAEPATGILYMIMDPGGAGRAPLPPFNEYALLAWLVRRAHPADHPYARLWDEVFAPERLGRLPHARYRGVSVLADDPLGQRFLSSFVHQFPFYLVHPYTESAAYRAELSAAAAVDRAYWRDQPGVPAHVWGLGAGASVAGYHADAANRCPDGIASPHIVAGFLPVYPRGVHDLVELSRREIPLARIRSAGADGVDAALRQAYRYGLHRFIALPAREGDSGRWVPPFVPLIDWSTMLYGLAALRRGIDFFARHNDWDG